MTQGREPEAEDEDGERPFLPRWAFWVAVPGLVGPLSILGFILWSESAHGVQDCPYEARRVIDLAPELTVQEDARRCMEHVEEHRFTLIRDGERRILGRRRFAPAAFAPERYRWHAEISEEGEVQIRVENEGHGEILFREGTPEERATGTSR